MTKEEIDARFAGLDEYIAQLDEVLAILRKHLPATESPWTLAERVAGLEMWAEEIVNRIDKLETGPIDAARVVLNEPAESLPALDEVLVGEQPEPVLHGVAGYVELVGQ